MKDMSKLVKDWFGRRAEDAYTYADDSKRLFSWDKGRSSYSSYFIRSDETLKNAAKMIGSMFRVVGVPKGYKYNANAQTGHSRDDAQTIQVPIQMLRDENGNYKDNDPQLLDAFYGAAIQNAALATMQTHSEYAATMRAEHRGKVSDLMFSVLNKERIDKKLADRLPGYLKFVQKYKDHTYGNIPAPDAMASKQERLMDLIVKMLRYPANLDPDTLEEFDKPIKQIERLLKKHGGIPETSSECGNMATSLANIVYKYIDEEEQQEEEQPGDGDGDGDGDQEAPKKSPAKSKSEMDELAKSMMKAMSPDEAPDNEEFQAEMEDFSEDMDEEKPKAPMHHSYEQEGVIAEGKVVWKKTVVKESTKDNYRSALKKIDVTKAAVLQKLLQRKSKDHAFVLKSMRSGRLDTNKIAEARQNVPTIYERIGHVKTNKITVGVLIDESGSMDGSKIQKAREAAIFINEVFRKMPDVDLYIYGHTADEGGPHNVNMQIYREKGSITDPFALGEVKARSNNRDGDAIIATARRIRQFTHNEGLLFVLSDGQPAGYDYHGQESIKDTRIKVSKAQALGFQVIQIAIEESVPSEQMFDYFIKMTNIKELPRELTSYMSRKVDKMIKSTVTL
jgi:uncharacterized protein with von Willebrand factor type A (vWA) domain